MSKQEIVRQFLRRLEEHGSILHKDVFQIMSDEAEKMGYQLSAYQGGIRGTHIVFEPKE